MKRRPQFVIIALAFAPVLALAARDDRHQTIAISTSGEFPAVIDLHRHLTTLAGDVIVKQGSLEIHADRVEMHEDADGIRFAHAWGSAAHPVTFSQKLDEADETSDGSAQTVEYDTGTNRIRFIGAAQMRVLRGSVVTNATEAPDIVYDVDSQTVKLSRDEPRAGRGDAADARPTIQIAPRPASKAVSAPPLALPDAPSAAPSAVAP
ncbi:MAG: lipopolysaccharide transport periplasmic protein LptA [Betaproteobacteria bacterium]